MRYEKFTLLGSLVLVLGSLWTGAAPAQEFGEWEEAPYVGNSCFGNPCFSPGPSLFWGDFEYLVWWRKGRETPPLVTTGDPADAVPGAIGEPGTQLLFGDERIGEQARSGGRATIGMWLAPYEMVGVGVTYFGLAEQTTRFRIDSAGDPLLGVAFLDPDLRTNALIVAQAGQAGSINITSSSTMHGGDAFLRGAMIRGGEVTVDWLAGYQTARIDENLTIATDAPGFFSSFDSYSTQNAFHGGAVGLKGQVRRGILTWDLLAKVGMGCMRQSVVAVGSNSLAPPVGGLFVEGVDSVALARNRLAVSPELGIKAAYDLTPFSRLTVGYSYLYFSRVVQPGDQLDPVVGDGRTTLAFNDHGYWVHGLNVGFNWEF